MLILYPDPRHFTGILERTKQRLQDLVPLYRTCNCDSAIALLRSTAQRCTQLEAAYCLELQAALEGNFPSKLQEAMQSIDRAEQIYRAFDDQHGITRCLAKRAGLYCHQYSQSGLQPELLTQATDEIAHCLSLAIHYRDTSVLSLTWLTRSMIHIWNNQPTLANSDLAEALTAIRQVDASKQTYLWYERGIIYLVMARRHMLGQQWMEAIRYLNVASSNLQRADIYEGRYEVEADCLRSICDIQRIVDTNPVALSPVLSAAQQQLNKATEFTEQISSLEMREIMATQFRISQLRTLISRYE